MCLKRLYQLTGLFSTVRGSGWVRSRSSAMNRTPQDIVDPAVDTYATPIFGFAPTRYRGVVLTVFTPI